MAAENEFEPHAGDEHILTDFGQASCEMAAESEFEPHACTTLGEGGGVRGNSLLLNFCHVTTPRVLWTVRGMHPYSFRGTVRKPSRVKGWG